MLKQFSLEKKKKEETLSKLLVNYSTKSVLNQILNNLYINLIIKH
jgi:hypothetical protein